jgi:hypothetical protein
MRTRLTERIARTASFTEELDSIATEIEQVSPHLALELDKVSDVLEGRTSLFGLGGPKKKPEGKPEEKSKDPNVRPLLATRPETAFSKVYSDSEAQAVAKSIIANLPQWALKDLPERLQKLSHQWALKGRIDVRELTKEFNVSVTPDLQLKLIKGSGIYTKGDLQKVVDTVERLVRK